MDLSPYHIVLSIDNNRVILYSLLTGRMHVTSETIYNRLKSGCKIADIDISIIDELKRSRIIVNSSSESILPASESDRLRLVILPTGECNLNCIYCGLKKEGAGKISLRTMEDIISFAEHHLSAIKYRALQIDWFGGEPSLCIHEITELARRFFSLAEKHNLKYFSRIVTNGILLNEENARILIEECHISSFEITVDGDSSYHNQRRKNNSDKGFYDIILHNIQHICEYDVRVSIRCNVDRSNRDGIFPLLEDLKHRDLNSKVHFYLAMIHSWGEEDGSSALPVEEFADIQFDVLKYMYKNGFNVTPNDILPFNGKRMGCTAKDKSAFVIDHRGFVYSCTETPYTSDRSAIMGHVKNPDKLYHRNMYLLPDEVTSKCNICPFFPVCGSCGKRCLEHCGNLECTPLKYNFDKRLRFFLEINQLP